MTRLITVPLTCPKCQRAMSVSLQSPQYFAVDQAPVLRSIRCPHEGCDGSLSARLHGEVTGTRADGGENHGP